MKFDTFTIHSNVDGDAGNVQLLDQWNSVRGQRKDASPYSVWRHLSCGVQKICWRGTVLMWPPWVLPLFTCSPGANDALEQYKYCGYWDKQL